MNLTTVDLNSIISEVTEDILAFQNTPQVNSISMKANPTHLEKAIKKIILSDFNGK